MQDDIPPMHRSRRLLSLTLLGFPSKWFFGRALGQRYCPETTSHLRSSRLVLLISALLTIALVGCGSEVGRIPFADTGTGRTEVMIEASKDVEFWTHLDLEEEGTDTLAEAIMAVEDVSLAYSIRLYQGGELVQRLTCDPFDISAFDWRTRYKSIKISGRSTHVFEYDGKMICSVNIKNTETTPLETILAPVKGRDSIKLEKNRYYGNRSHSCSRETE